MRILITGGTGLLGEALIETNGLHNHDISAVYLGDYEAPEGRGVRYFNADICSESGMEDIFRKVKPEAVIHTAGIANVDTCEKDRDRAWKSNVYGTKVITDLCKQYGSKPVFISTNAVFDGEGAPYSEDSAPSPINSYGKMKLEAEDVVRKSGPGHLIVRPILMYGWNNEHERSNTVTWLIAKLKNGEKVNIVNDVYENPLFNISCAEMLWALIGLKREGLYHAAGKDVVNRYEFACLIADVFGLDRRLISQVSSDFFPSIAPRPRNTSYNTSKIERGLNIKALGLKDGLTTMKNMRKVY